jgi:hypothetical protein
LKNSVFTSHVLSNDAISSLEEIAHTADCTFSKLATIAGLNPERDFRFADLRELDFSHSDLRGYDFTGADLTSVVGAHAIVDETTILADAIVDDSIFSSRIRLENFFAKDDRAKTMLDKVSRQDWAGQILWSGKHILLSRTNLDIAIAVTEALFYRADDGFLKAELLSHLASRTQSTKMMRELLIRAFSEFSYSTTIVNKCLKLIRKSKLSQDKTIRRSIMALAGAALEPQNLEPLRFLIKTSRNRDELLQLNQVAIRQGRDSVYVQEIGVRLGEVYDLITRDPITNETFPSAISVALRTRDLIARRWARAESMRRSNNTSKSLVEIKPGLSASEDADTIKKAKEVEQMWRELNDYGIDIRLDLPDVSTVSTRTAVALATPEGNGATSH